jgi:hypothetical protein
MHRRLPPEAGFAGLETRRDMFRELPEEAVDRGNPWFPHPQDRGV